ncbi:MAG: M23 family metallopeptidase [Clostridia bacterium]
MEKIISPEERIRRAEEIYYRRKLNNNDVRMPSSQVKGGKEKKQFSLYRKMLIQILICILIYLIFSLIKEANYLFSENVINKTKEFLNSDINFEVISSNISKFFEENKDKFNFINKPVDNEENIQTNNVVENNEVQNEQQNNEEQNNELQINTNVQNETTGIGGATTNEQVVSTSTQSSSKKTQMEIDAEYIKTNFTMQLPVKASITSHYGKREATEIVSENHQGIDLGVVVGTTIVAAMAGEVSVVSNAGEYGTHVKIVNKDVTTIYAHCSKILVKKGQTIKKGEKIALSGNTGKTTGPHLHFEIQRSGRSIDPELILDWG